MPPCDSSGRLDLVWVGHIWLPGPVLGSQNVVQYTSTGEVMSTFTFTDRRLDTIEINKSRSEFRDEKVPGLLIRVGAAGKSFWYRKRLNGRRVQQRLGTFPTLTVEGARQAAKSLAAAAALGRDPQLEKFRNQSIGELYDAFMARCRSDQLTPKTIKFYQNEWKHRLYRLSDYRLNEITRSMLQGLRERWMEEFGRSSVHRALRTFKAMLNYAHSRSWIDTNPAVGIKLPTMQSRKRYLEAHEVGPIIRELERQRSTVADAMLFALFTGRRRDEILTAKWEDINLEAATWDIPRTKNGDPFRVYLTPYTLSILTQLRERSRSKSWVFEGRSASGRAVEPKGALIRAFSDAGLELRGMCMHSLRHTFITYAARAGLSLPVLQRVAGHKRSGNITLDVYSHYSEEEIREAYGKVAGEIEKLRGG